MTAPDEATVQRYARQGIALMPPGKALSKRLDSTIRAVLEAAAVPFARVHEDAAALRRELLPLHADALLDAWEEVTGLPNCDGTPTDTASRQAGLVAHLVASGGQSDDDFKAIAAALGFEVELAHEYLPMTCTSPCTSAVADIDWAFHKLVEVVDSEPDASRDLLKCRFEAHAHIYGHLGWETYLMVDGEFLLVDGEPLTIHG